MTSFTSGAASVIGIGLAAVCGAMILHMLTRALRSTRERQADLDLFVANALRDGAATDELYRRLRGAQHDLARRSLVHALATLGPSSLTLIRQVYGELGFAPRATRALRAFSWTKRAEAAMELGAMGQLDAAPDCLRMLADRRAAVRIAAARALSDMAAPGALRSILESIPQATRWSISDSVAMIHGFGMDAIPELHDTVVQSPSRVARLASIEALGELCDATALPMLKQLADDKDFEIRAYVARALGRIGGPEVLDTLARLIKDASWEVRAVAARALGACRIPEGVVIVQSALYDPSWWVRLNAAEALAEQGEGEASLRQTLSSSKDIFARAMAAQMLQSLQIRSSP